MFKRFLAYLTRHIVTDVPDEISACIECSVTQCVEGKFRNCPNRLARFAALKAMHDQPANVRP
jgi:hypothetical protein